MSDYNEQIIRRGEIYYIRKGKISEESSLYEGGRPGVIVSNNLCNTHSPVVEVVYLTTQEKNDLPTHVLIDDATANLREPSTALCEQIQSAPKSRIGQYKGRVSDATMELIDKALAVSVGIDCYIGERAEVEVKEVIKEVVKEVPVEVIKEVPVYIPDPNHPQKEEPRETLITHDEILTKYKVEAEFYKAQCETLLNRILEKI